METTTNPATGQKHERQPERPTASLVVIDLEGTGAQDRDDEAILEIALVPLVAGLPDMPTSYTTLINPGRPIAARPWLSPGLTDATLRRAPALADIERHLADRINARYLVGHNVSVDWRLLHRQLPALRPAGLIDTLRLAKALTTGRSRALTALIQARYRSKPVSLTQHVLAVGRAGAQTIGWREGSKGRLESQFVLLRVRVAGRRPRLSADGSVPLSWLIAQWPDGESEPVKYWLSNLPADTDPATLVRLGKIRWRIEPDYRELKTGLGLDHFEGRSWIGWHRHVTPSPPPRTCSSPHCDSTQKRLRRPDPLHLACNTSGDAPSICSRSRSTAAALPGRVGSGRGSSARGRRA